LYAFEHNVERLAEDHDNARLLEAGIAEIPGLELANGPVETNILFFEVTKPGKTPAEVAAAIEKNGVRMSYQYSDPTRIRAVTHLDVTRADCERALVALKSAVA
jgi:threonine aldolase